MSNRIIFYDDKEGKTRWHIMAENGNILADSAEGYSRLIDAHTALRSIFEDTLGVDQLKGTPVTVHTQVNFGASGALEQEGFAVTADAPEVMVPPYDPERKCEHGYGVKQGPCPVCDAPKGERI